MNRRVIAAGVLTLAGAVPLWWGQPAASQSADAGLELTAQTFAVSPGGVARFEFVVTGDVPEIAPTTTTAPRMPPTHAPTRRFGGSSKGSHGSSAPPPPTQRDSSWPSGYPAGPTASAWKVFE